MNIRGIAIMFVYFIIGLIYLCFFGLYTPTGITIDIEYVNGLFAVASILTGFLAAIITIEPRNILEEFYIEEIFGYMVILNLILLGISTVFYSIAAFLAKVYLTYTFVILDGVIILDIVTLCMIFPRWLKIRESQNQVKT